MGKALNKARLVSGPRETEWTPGISHLSSKFSEYTCQHDMFLLDGLTMKENFQIGESAQRGLAHPDLLCCINMSISGLENSSRYIRAERVKNNLKSVLPASV